RGQAQQYQFTLDTTPPPAPGIDPVISPTNNPNQTITGTKEAYAAILLDGVQIVGHTSSTTWQYSVTLSSANDGQNVLTFAARDQAGNQSDSALAEISFDDIAPLPVTTLTVDGDGDGTSAALNWSGYDESEHGDIASYRIYVETAPFSDVSALAVKDSVNAGQLSATVNDLTRNTTYWFA
ncbi:MAG: fibronectin type III domain-containing protein, partial [Gammaproteobacteria bacterium]|nr:fibronectin type III domain-containing protein [Gammaproteobacteria bacterium]